MKIINKTMDRDDLKIPEAQIIIKDILKMLDEMRSKDCLPSTWVGKVDMKDSYLPPDKDSRNLDYIPIFKDPSLDARYPWFLLWEIYWVLTNTDIPKNGTILDAGGSASLASFYLAYRGYNVISVELDDRLVNYANMVSRKLMLPMYAFKTSIGAMNYIDESVCDAAVSICTFEHLDWPIKVSSLREIARVLKRGAPLSLTFDYRNPLLQVWGYGKDNRPRNRISTPEDVKNQFNSKYYDIRGNEPFIDNGKNYLKHPKTGDPYTFGAYFLKRRTS